MEEESVCGGGSARAAAIARLHDFWNFCGLKLVRCDVKEGADDIAYHFIEKAVAFKFKAESARFWDGI